MEKLINLIEKLFAPTLTINEGYEITRNTSIFLKKRLAVTYFNSGEVTAIIDGKYPIPPEGSLTDSNPARCTFSADQTITFDVADTYGKNTGVTQRLNVITKKYY